MLDLWGNAIQQEQEPEKDKSGSFFDCVNAIQNKYTEITPELVSLYNEFMVNKTFQQNICTIQIANLMNTLHALPKEVQFKFYKLMFPNGVKRSKFNKKQVDTDINKLLKLGYTNKQADYIKYVLTEEQLKNFIKSDQKQRNK